MDFEVLVAKLSSFLEGVALSTKHNTAEEDDMINMFAESLYWNNIAMAIYYNIHIMLINK